jgi:tryptophan synthase alpha chain
VLSRIENKFVECKSNGEGALVIYIMAGDPDYDRSMTALRAVADGGADVIEFGVPFSDPMADGRVIEQAALRALKSGIYLLQIFKMVREFRQNYETPILLMTYWNPVLQYGIERACVDAKAAGVDGFLIVDLPPEEATEWLIEAKHNKLDTIFLLAPTSPDKRIRIVTEQGSGFVYCISRLGVTGVQSELPPDLFKLIDNIKSITDKPVAVGFGIGTPEQVREVCTHADGAIVGSAPVKVIAENADGDLYGTLKLFISELKEATKNKK